MEIGEEIGIEISSLNENFKDDTTCTLYLTMAWFGRVWGWQPSEVLKMPIRRRLVLFEYLSTQIKKYPPMV